MKVRTIQQRKGFWIPGLALIAMWMTAASVQSATYPDMPYKGPSPAPGFPADFKAFDPPVHSNPVNTGAPAIAEWTRSNEPGDTLMLTGSHLSAVSGEAEGRDTHFVFFGQSGLSPVEADGLIQRLDGMQVAVTLPDTLPVNEMYLMWPKNDNGCGIPIGINQSEMWWIGPDKVSTGGILSIYGRNLTLGNGDSHLYIEELDQWLKSVSANPYKADFVLPTDIENGTFTVWAHNGSGLQHGWSKPMKITVVDAVVWNGPTINVVDYGAKGDGVSDDFSAIKAALDDAKNMDHPTVYFPAGTYLLSGSLHNAKYDMRLMGAGMDETVISTHPSYGNNANYIYGLFFSNSQTGPTKFSDMTISSGSYLGNSAIGPTLIYCRNGIKGIFENVRFTQLDHPDHTSHSPIIDMGGSSYMTFHDCEFILAGAVDVNEYSRQAVFDGCTFKGINDVNFMINTGASSECSVTDCLAMNYDNSDINDGHGWAQGRFVYGSGRNGRIGEIYYGGNTTSNLTVRETYTAEQNTGEQFMTEFGRTLVRANPTSANPMSVTFPSLTEDYTDKIITIVGGSGIGQNRVIASTSGNTVTVDQPWRVAPDPSSIVMIGNFARRHVVYNSSFDGVERAVTTDVPSTAGVMPYGSQLEMVVASNSFHQLKHGISIWGIQNVDGANIWCRPLYFNLFTDNTFVRCRRAIDTSVPTYNGSPTAWDINILGNVFRNNSISNSTEYAFRNRTWEDTHSIAMCVYDQNTSIDCVTNIGDDMGLRNQIWVGNKFTSFNGGTGLLISSDHIPGLHKNTWEGFSSTYGGTLPGSVLEVPKRVISLGRDSLVAEVAVRNSGTATLNWSASTTSEWVNIIQPSGTVSDENSEGVLIFQADEAKVPAGESEAVIAIFSDTGQEQQITVELVAAEPPPPDPPPAPVLSGIVVAGPSSVDEGASAQYVCTASYSDGTTTQVTPNWTENSSNADIDGAGVLSAGDVAADEGMTVSASYGGYTDTYDLTIRYTPAVLTGVTISAPPSVTEGTTAQFTCDANYSDGTTLAVTPTWSENSASATINSSGVFTAGDVTSDQVVTVTANFGDQSDTYAITVNYVPPVLTGIVVSGLASLDEGTTEQYICTAAYSDGTSAVVTPTWSENSAYTTINGSGELSAGNVGADQNVTVTAAFGGLTDGYAVTVRYVVPVLTGVSISGRSSVPEESSEQYTCTAIYSDGTTAVVTPSWSENSAFATISSSGLLTAGDVTASQSVTVTASHDGKSDTHTVTITYTPPSVTSLAISGPGTVGENTTAQYVCTATYSDGSSAQVNPIWTIDSASAAIGGSGLLSAGNITADEQATVQASFSGKVAAQLVQITVVGDQVVLELNGFDGKTVSAELWDDVAQTTVELGEEFEPEEIIIENVNPDQWYWLGLREYDANAGEWVLVHGRWIWM